MKSLFGWLTSAPLESNSSSMGMSSISSARWRGEALSKSNRFTSAPVCECNGMEGTLEMCGARLPQNYRPTTCFYSTWLRRLFQACMVCTGEPIRVWQCRCRKDSSLCAQRIQLYFLKQECKEHCDNVKVHDFVTTSWFHFEALRTVSRKQV